MNRTLKFPALRGMQGSRIVYTLLPNMAEIKMFFARQPEQDEVRVQRVLDERHADDIRVYADRNRDSYVLGGLTLTLEEDGIFTPSEADKSMGMLELPYDAFVRSIDGQHRQRAVVDLVNAGSWRAFAGHNAAILLYVESDVTKRMQMFSDMNATPKIVAKALNVAFDERDPFARVAKRLVAEHPALVGRVETTLPKVNPKTNKLFHLGAIHDSLKRLLVGVTGRARAPQSFSEENIYSTGKLFFDVLQKARPDLFVARTAEEVVIARTQSILFSSTTLRVIAGAVHDALKVGVKPDDMVKRLAGIDFAPKAWVENGFVPAGKTTPSARTQEVAGAARALKEALILRLAA